MGFLDRIHAMAKGSLMPLYNAWYSILIDCMVFNAVFNSISVYIAAASAPIHAFLEFF